MHKGGFPYHTIRIADLRPGSRWSGTGAATNPGDRRRDTVLAGRQSNRQMKTAPERHFAQAQKATALLARRPLGINMIHATSQSFGCFFSSCPRRWQRQAIRGRAISWRRNRHKSRPSAPSKATISMLPPAPDRRLHQRLPARFANVRWSLPEPPSVPADAEVKPG